MEDDIKYDIDVRLQPDDLETSRALCIFVTFVKCQQLGAAVNMDKVASALNGTLHGKFFVVSYFQFYLHLDITHLFIFIFFLNLLKTDFFY